MRFYIKKYAHQLDVKPELIATNALDQKFIEQATHVVETNLEDSNFNIDSFTKEMGVGENCLISKDKSCNRGYSK